jgi:hypothetical protein
VKRQTKEDATPKSRYKKHIITAVLAVIIISIPAAYFLCIHLGQSPKPKAAIIDQLSSSQLSLVSRYENFTFVNATRALLYKRFSTVDYYSDNATIEEYRRLSAEGYKLIIWRTHSALDNSSMFIAVSTSEVYDPSSKEHSNYLDNGQATLCKIAGDPKSYVAVTPRFIKDVMIGKFEDTVLILMSCNGLKEGYHDTAKALQEKGARAVISWDGWVDSSVNDNAIDLFLQHLITENDTVKQAVDKIPRQDSTWEPFGTWLGYYPDAPEAADYHIPDYRENQTTSNIVFALMMTSRKNKDAVGHS